VRRTTLRQFAPSSATILRPRRGADAGFSGVIEDVRTVLDSGLDVFAQNVETVRRLTHRCAIRARLRTNPRGIARAKAYRPEVLSKTS